MSQPPIDIDTESVQFDGHWYTREALAGRIKGMLDAGDFAVSRPSQALESLTQTLSSLRTLAFRATPELADALNAAAARHGKTVGAVIRDAMTSLLGMPVADGPAPTGPRENLPAGRRPTDPELPAAPRAPEAPQGQAVPPHLTPAAPGVQAGPGALKSAELNRPTVVVEEASAEDAAGAVDLTAKKTKEEEAVERRWFGG
ncbi:MAG: hypothetical protein ACYC8T_10845 [Myxococcaceae bacterium]